MTSPSVVARRTRRPPAAAWGAALAVALAVLAMAVPAVTGWNVRVNSFPPLHAEWDPRVGWGTAPALLVGVLVSLRAVATAELLPWRRLLAWTFVAGLVWLLALAYVDGPDGVGEILDTEYEYLNTARDFSDLGPTMADWVRRIPYRAPDNYQVHVAGHPPGATLFFVGLVRIGLGSGFAAGLVVTLLSATTALGAMVTARTLGAERLARRAAPFLAFGPAAVWQSVSADGMFAATAAWGIACLAIGAVRRSVAWSALAGLLLGWCVMLSYGLPLLGVLAIAVLVVARSWLPLPVAAGAALVPVGIFWWLGFNYVEAIPALRERYFEGVGGRRPMSYWWWGSIATLAFAAGPLAFAGVAHVASRWREYVAGPAARVVVWLAGSGVVMVLLADASRMSKAETERIWLPFVPWLLLSCALLPERWRRWGLVAQVVVALVVQHLLFTGW